VSRSQSPEQPSKAELDHRELQHREIVDRELLEACPNSPALLEPTDATLDDIPPSVGLPVEARSLSGLAVATPLPGNDVFDPMLSKPGSDSWDVVGLVSG
jgi:hypothetical protein